MKKHADELVFISMIRSDGKSVADVSGRDSMRDCIYTLTPLSLTERTFIAHGPINTYVVKLK
jgi:hypothetical protein